MTSENEVESFLKDFKFKLDFWGLIFRSDRKKNFGTILKLEISTSDIRKVLKALVVKDYSAGPIEETLYKGADMWVFGKIVKKMEVYIKITLGAPGSEVICISFHFPERKMMYPFK